MKVLNFLIHSSAHVGSSVQLTHATFTPFHPSSVLSSSSIPPDIPRSLTFCPLQSFKTSSLSTVNGAPPPQSMYISGVQIVPSRSNATTFGRDDDMGAANPRASGAKVRSAQTSAKEFSVKRIMTVGWYSGVSRFVDSSMRNKVVEREDLDVAGREAPPSQRGAGR